MLRQGGRVKGGKSKIVRVENYHNLFPQVFFTVGVALVGGVYVATMLALNGY